MIISGDAALQMAFEKFEKGDKDAMAQYCKAISARKGSVDLLENMDLSKEALRDACELEPTAFAAPPNS